MREQPRRQLFSACQAVLLALAGLVFCVVRAKGTEANGKPDGLGNELKAARFTEYSVMSGTDGKGSPSPEDVEKISRMYKQIVERNPKSADAWNADAEFLWSIRKHSEAMKEWMTAETLEPGNAAVANHLGECNIELGEVKEATEYFEQAARLNPKNALYQFAAGNASFLFRHAMTDGANDEHAVMLRALEHFRRAAQIEPFNTDYAQAYAETFYAFQSPDWNVALLAWRHYLEITDYKDFAYSNLARVNLKLGHKREARDDLAKIQSAKFDTLKKLLTTEAGN